MNDIVHVLGPTGVGKSQLAVEIAIRFAGEIISADSVQVYRDFNIGTDKISADRRCRIPHHLIDIIADCSQFNAARFLEESQRRCNEIISRGKLPVVCGGTAFYLKTMIRGIFPETKAEPGIRRQLADLADEKGLGFLWQRLRRIDPVYAGTISANDRVRIIRALEIEHNTGLPPTAVFAKTSTPFKDFRFIRIGLNLERHELYERINRRIDRMIELGFVDEVKTLMSRYPKSCPPFQAVGYREMVQHLEGEIGFDRAVELIKQHSRQFAKRQLSWFRQEKDIRWFDPRQGVEEIEHFLREQLWNRP